MAESAAEGLSLRAIEAIRRRVFHRGVSHVGGYGDTWYPSWASDGNMYSPWTDGTTEGVTSVSIENDTDWKIATTGNAVMIGDDPQNLIIKNTRRRK